MPQFKPEIRASAIDDYLDCNGRGIARIFRDILKSEGVSLNEEPSLVPVYNGIGTGAHKGAEHTLNEKLNGVEASLSDTEEISINKLHKELSGGASFDASTRNMNTAEKQLRQICRTYYYMILPDKKPVKTEVPLRAENTDFILTGHPDVIETVRISDLKTGAQASNYFAQMGVYSLLARSEGFNQPEYLQIDHIPRSKPNQEPTPCLYDTETCESVAFEGAARIATDINNFLETADPTVISRNPRSMICGPKYCPAFDTDFCPITKRR